MRGPAGVVIRAADSQCRAVSNPRRPGYDVFCSGHSFLADGTLFVAGGHISDFMGIYEVRKKQRGSPSRVTTTWTRGRAPGTVTGSGRRHRWRLRRRGAGHAGDATSC